jgi:DNA polymerase-1
MNLQNIPRDDLTIKRAIIPKLGALSFFDYAAIEPRLFAYYAAEMGHPNLSQRIIAGYDPYTAIATTVLQKDNITKEERQVWKRVFLGILYGAGVKRVRETWIYETGETITMKQATKIRDTFNETIPELKQMQSMVERVSARRGYIVGIDGRHLHPEPFGGYKMLNKLIQGSAAGIMKQAIVRVNNWIQKYQGDAQIISVVHDELQIDSTLDLVERLHGHVPALMTHEKMNAVVPVEVDHEVSTTSWAEKAPYDEWRKAA